MIEVEIASASSFLGTHHITAGDTELVRLRADMLTPGEKVTGATASSTSTTSGPGTPTLRHNHLEVDMLVTVGSLGETFTIALRITTTDGQVLNYTIAFTVDAPVLITNPGQVVLLGGDGATGPTGPAGDGGDDAVLQILVTGAG